MGCTKTFLWDASLGQSAYNEHEYGKILVIEIQFRNNKMITANLY